MKKVLILMVMFCLFTNVYAEVCSNSRIQELQNNINDLSFTIKNEEIYMDMNGDYHEGYFSIYLDKNYSDYVIEVGDKYDKYTLDSILPVYLNGGAYDVLVYNNNCDKQVIKEFQIFIPYYKQFCGDESCDNKWFDGTYQLVSDNNDILEKAQTIINSRLIFIILSLLVIIAVLVIFIRIRRRKKL